jgi:hypothetical protein
MKIEKLNDNQYAIIRELQEAFADLGADAGVHAALGSWGDTQAESDVLQMLRDYNALSGRPQRRFRPHTSVASSGY